MKFACPKCKTRYSVADDKLPADKTLRFTCKKCGDIFKLRRKPRTGTPAAAARPVTGAVLAEADGAEATRVANLSEIMAVKRRSREDEPEPAPPASPFVNEDEWFVLAGGKQKGPMAVSEIERMLGARLIDSRTYVWRDGMGDWLRLGSVPELAGLRAPPPPPKRPPAAPAPMGDNTGETVAMDSGKLQEQLNRLKDATDGSGAGPSPKVKKERQPARNDAALAALVGEPVGKPMARRDSNADGSPLDDFDLESPGPTKERPIPHFAPEDSEGDSPSGVFADAPTDQFFDHSALSAPSQPPDYYNAAPGEATRVFMATAGLYKRRRNQKIAAAVGISFTIGLATVAAMDITGFIQIPGMGVMYDITGVEDPNAERAIARVEQTLAREDLSDAERADIERRRLSLRGRLLGSGPADNDEPRAPRKAKARAAAADDTPVAAQIGIQEAQPSSAEDHDLTAAIMGDQRKNSAAPTLKPPTELQTPNLPEGLTQDAIFEVINRNQRAMSLCISQSMKAGEKLEGKMEVQMSIAANGSVESADIGTERFNGTTIGECTVRTVKRWKFPRFNGQPVTVIFPYVLSSGF